MGQEESRPSSQELVRNDEGNFVVISNSLPESFHFEPSESCVISYGIDKQSSPRFKHKSLTYITVDDAEQVLNAFVGVGAIPHKNTHLFSASRNPESCTVVGMKMTFQHHASEVGPNGLFVFHFSGHGIRVRNEMWGLAPMDFDYSTDTYITANVLSQWLNEIECRAKYILITLDCCYAGGIGKELATQADVTRNTDLYILSACTANETSLVLASLGHSIFTYFLSSSIMRFGRVAGILPIKEAFSECQACCECLSSLLVSYSKENGLQMKVMQPQLSVRNVLSDGEDSTDAAVAIGRFQYVMELYDQNIIAPLDDKTMAYLDSLRDVTNGPLYQLERRGLLSGKVIVSVFCSIMYSIASIELACDSTLEKVKNINLSITAFMQAASTIDMIHNGVVFDASAFFLSWLFYKEVMSKNKIEVAGIAQLERKLRHRYSGTSANFGQRGEDMTDSGEITRSGEITEMESLVS